MSKTIWKFPLAGDGTVMMPIGAPTCGLLAVITAGLPLVPLAATA